MNRDALLAALQPVLDVVRTVDPRDPAAAARTLDERLPPDGEVLRGIRALVRAGVEARWICERENGSVRWSRVAKDAGGLSIDAVHMSTDGAAHTHPGGEIDLAFAVSGEPRFDGRPAGWTVYPPGSWHVPTVEGGAMDILYFLPGGAIQFGPRPDGATGVGLQAE